MKLYEETAFPPPRPSIFCHDKISDVIHYFCNGNNNLMSVSLIPVRCFLLKQL